MDNNITILTDAAVDNGSIFEKPIYNVAGGHDDGGIAVRCLIS